ncbi:MAG: prolyl oligopeptidase family serine peptidase, partial [Thermoanaerobaculia bacterium]|nr:prolyl oligopeptidase family serine peptidase [Thermoanaerobaculia bacterium]
VYAYGGSAGGLLMGAVMNMAPELYHGIVAAVPFVDVVTTMLDESIPLTTGEFDEWGDPRDPTYYEYMLSYSPYDNVRAQDYPHLLVTAGLHDSQVQYWEPAKWVARLRATKTDDNLLLLHTNMEAGHGGASGRFRALKETALVYAFLCSLSEVE